MGIVNRYKCGRDDCFDIALDIKRRNWGGVGEIKRFPIAGRVKSGATRPE